jgi:hypothetical protein
MLNKPNILDIAEKTGFSITTVSVISNFACTIFGKVECTENGNMACT